jgi:hypothetical protein
MSVMMMYKSNPGAKWCNEAPTHPVWMKQLLADASFGGYDTNKKRN